MNVILYNISAPPEKIGKISSGTTGTTVEGVIFADDDYLDIINPKIKLNMNTEISQNLKYNYLKIPKLGRYYFIKRVSTEGGLMVYDCEVDPLESFKEDILGSTQYIIRSEKYNNRMIVDSLLPLHSDHNILINNFGDDVYIKSCDHVILETIGSGGNPS